MLAKNILSLTEARKNIFSLVDEVNKENTTFILTEHGRAKAALISIALFDRISDSSSKKRVPQFPQSFFVKNSVSAPVWMVRDGDEVGYQRDSTDAWEEERAYARSILYVTLVEKFKHEPQRIEVGHHVELSSSSGSQHFEIDLIVSDQGGNPFMVCMLIPWTATLKEQEEAIRLFYLLIENVDITAKPSWLVGFSYEYKNKKGQSRAFVIDYKKYPTFALWQAGGKERKEELAF
jgi:prevent-host-death family protein